MGDIRRRLAAVGGDRLGIARAGEEARRHERALAAVQLAGRGGGGGGEHGHRISRSGRRPQGADRRLHARTPNPRVRQTPRPCGKPHGRAANPTAVRQTPRPCGEPHHRPDTLSGPMPTVEGLQFAYALHPVPPGRLPFRRWRWELWHGSTMVGRRLAAVAPAGRPCAARLRVRVRPPAVRAPAARSRPAGRRRRPAARDRRAPGDRLDHLHARPAGAGRAGRHRRQRVAIRQQDGSDFCPDRPVSRKVW